MAMSQSNDHAGPLRIVRRFARKMKAGSGGSRGDGGGGSAVTEAAAAPTTVKARPLPSMNDVFAGGAARAAAQATIHPLDTLKVRPLFCAQPRCTLREQRVEDAHVSLLVHLLHLGEGCACTPRSMRVSLKGGC
jgi:hypothetical protein